MAGDHTRTIQIATPTVGGLMKFAVKTVTCLGCRTVLRTNKGWCAILGLPHVNVLIANIPIDGAVCANCRPRLGELYQKQVSRPGSPPEGSCLILRNVLRHPGGVGFSTASGLCPAVDAVPALSGFLAPSERQSQRNRSRILIVPI